MVARPAHLVNPAERSTGKRSQHNLTRCIGTGEPFPVPFVVLHGPEESPDRDPKIDVDGPATQPES